MLKIKEMKEKGKSNFINIDGMVKQFSLYFEDSVHLNNTRDC